MKCENLWRINIKPDVKNGENPREFCIKNNILGVGWSVGKYQISEVSDYNKLAEPIYCFDKDGNKQKTTSWKKAINIIQEDMKVNDLCWTRDDKGIFYLGRITEAWEYRHEDEYQQLDLVNIRKCKWIKVGTVDGVPGKVINSFSLPMTVQRVKDTSALKYSELIYNKKSNTQCYELEKPELDIFSLLSPDDCENVIGLYLQKELGYYIIPKTNKKYTKKYEFVLKRRVEDKDEKAIVQVKNGDVSLNRDEFKDIADKVFLFTTEGKYIGNEDKDIICLEKQVIEKFIYDNEAIMPDLVQNWIKYIKEGNI